jgi:hypothetical protein
MKSNAAQCCRIVGRKRAFTLAKKYGPRPRKPLVVLVLAACIAIHGQVSPKQMADPAVVALGSGFFSDTARVNGATLHYVRGGAGPAVILPIGGRSGSPAAAQDSATQGLKAWRRNERRLRLRQARHSGVRLAEIQSVRKGYSHQCWRRAESEAQAPSATQSTSRRRCDRTPTR